MNEPSNENIEFQKSIFKNVSDDDYIAFAERNDRIKNLLRGLNANPGLISNIKTLMDYRDLRTQQAWIPNFIRELDKNPDVSDLEIDRLKGTVQKLDRDRRKYHNIALGNFYGMVNDMKRRGISFYYRGKLMDPNKEPDKYGDPNIRQEMTDFFLNSLYEIEEMSITELQVNYGEKFPEGVESLKKVRCDLINSSRSYDVREPLRQDDGDITFYK